MHIETFMFQAWLCCHSYRKRFAVDVDPLVDQMVDKAKVEESEYKANESQKQV